MKTKTLLPPLPPQWLDSIKMPGWAVCFDPADQVNFLHKMKASADGSVWVRHGALTAEDMVFIIRSEDDRLAPYKPLAQARLDEMHAYMAAQRERSAA